MRPLVVFAVLATVVIVGSVLWGPLLGGIQAWIDEPLHRDSTARGIVNLVAPGSLSRPTLDSSLVAPTPTPYPTPTAGPTPRPVATVPPATPPALGQGRAIVSNTDGQGVALRAGPGGDRLPGKGYDEGVQVTVLERQGQWAHIRGDDGREGWVLSATVP